MAQPEWTSFFSQLVRDYVAAGAGAEGVPAESVLAQVMQDDTAAAKEPRMVWTCEPEPRTHPDVFEGVITGTLELTTRKGSTGPADAAEWMGAMDQRLRDNAAMSEWMGDLSEARRTGWQIINKQVMPVAVDADPEAGMQRRALRVRIYAMVQRSV